MKRVDGYLARYADVRAVDAAARVRGAFSAAVVIPARDETPAVLERCAPALAGRDALAIIVVNGDADDPVRVHEANAALLSALLAHGASTPLAPGLALVATAAATLLVVDCASASRWLPVGQGVGRARRIGCDIALALWRRGVVARRFLDTTDADATLPADYFDAGDHRAVAVTRSFTHVPSGDTAIDQATALYELTLRYYVAGLASAGSPWSMHTIGSCIAVDADAYATARGLPLRPAGEDFYLLAKVAKLGRVDRGAGAPVRIESRRSARVPFGTGPGAALIAETLEAGGVPAVYDPASFVALGRTLEAIGRWTATPGARLRIEGDDVLAAALTETGLVAGVERAAAQAKTPAQRLRKSMEWLDAFRTLKLIHALRSQGHTPVPWPRAVAALAGEVMDVVAANEALTRLEADAPDAGLYAQRVG